MCVVTIGSEDHRLQQVESESDVQTFGLSIDP